MYDKVIWDRVTEYLLKAIFYYEKKYGFMKNRSTALGLVETLDKVYNSLD